MIRWVLDTNVIVSGFLKSGGAPARLLDEFFAQRLCLVYDGRTIAEYADVLSRTELGIEPRDSLGFFLMLRSTGECISAPPLALELPDPDDLPFVELAAASPGKTVVTRNTAHFRPAQSLGIRILSPEEAVALLILR